MAPSVVGVVNSALRAVVASSLRAEHLAREIIISACSFPFFSFLFVFPRPLPSPLFIFFRNLVVADATKSRIRLMKRRGLRSHFTSRRRNCARARARKGKRKERPKKVERGKRGGKGEKLFSALPPNPRVLKPERRVS